MMKGMTMDATNIPDDSWTTYQSHPASGLAYQESTAGEMTAARVVQDGHEVVSPDFDVDRAYRQYSGRVQRAIEELEQPVYGAAADRLRDELHRPCRGYGAECGVPVAPQPGQDPGAGRLCPDCTMARLDAESPRIPR